MYTRKKMWKKLEFEYKIISAEMKAFAVRCYCYFKKSAILFEMSLLKIAHAFGIFTYFL